MFQNIKVDIIYYKTNTDFELEFNLCGCCRMRLLTDKASDTQGLVHHLARAIARSRVILIAGNLFGDDGIISTVAQSIGKSLTEISNRRYGISSDDSIKIINGSTPLVTPEGYFGGCIIESGPQSMILVSENKTVRKSIMTSLIHPYIEELCALELKESAAAAAAAVPAAAIEPDDNFNVTPEADTIESNEIPSVANEPQNTEISDSENQAPQIDSNYNYNYDDDNEADIKLSSGMIYESDEPENSAESSAPLKRVIMNSIANIDKQAENHERNHYIEKSDLLEFDEEEEVYIKPPHESKTFSGNILILIISILLLIVLAVLCYCIFYIPSKEGISTSTYLQQTFHSLFG